jgi:hypothetical protein
MWRVGIVSSFLNIIPALCVNGGGSVLCHFSLMPFFSACCFLDCHFQHYIQDVFFLVTIYIYFLQHVFQHMFCFNVIFFQIASSLWKKTFKNSTQTIFQEGSPWATLILNSMFAVGAFYCVQLFSERNISYIPLFLSLAKLLQLNELLSFNLESVKNKLKSIEHQVK